jgi:hypothetical protein
MNTKFKQGITLLVTLMLFSAVLTGCLAPATDNSAQATLNALAVQVTIAAMEKEQSTSADDDNAQQTQVAQAVQATLNAAQPPAEPTAEPPPEEEIVEPEPIAEPDNEQDLADFETWMKTAAILLYEDMAGVYTTTRFVQEALESLGLDYVDLKDAVGHFKEQLLSGGPGGEGWDLIISAKEARGLVKGEIYEYINDNYNNGSSVIIEEWQLDSIVVGKVALLLNRCDVEWQDDWYWDPIQNQLLWPVDGTLAIHHQPNEGIALTNPSQYWGTELGDFLRLAPGSKADVLWVARANVKDTFITAVSCDENRLIFQTYATHSYGKDRIVRMWENYIYNALLARYELLSE